MIGSFSKEHTIAIGAMVSLLGFGYWLSGMEEARKLRFAHKFQSSVQPFNLKTLPYVPQPKLMEDIKGEIKATIQGEKAGVRILWGIPGSGKTTTTKAAMNELVAEKAIAGCIYISLNANREVGHAENFRRHLADWRGPLLLPHEKLSSLLGNSPSSHDSKPYVIILDQMDDPVPFDDKLKQFVKTLAHDSDSCKSYIVILLTTDCVRAIDAYEWNGRTKITFLGRSKPWEYRWTRDEISTWLRHFKETHANDEEIFALLDEDADSYKRFMEVACHAGTPGFLVNGIDELKAFNFPILKADSDKSSTMWELGTKTLLEFEGTAPKG